MFSLKAEVHMPKRAAEMLAEMNLESGGLVQQTVDKAVIDYCIPYCPMDSGMLANSAYTATRIGSGIVKWPGPYAHYMYYGKVYGPNIPVFDDASGDPTGFFSPPNQKKSPTGRELQYNTDINPLAGPFWFERMKADHLNDILREARKVATGK